MNLAAFNGGADRAADGPPASFASDLASSLDEVRARGTRINVCGRLEVRTMNLLFGNFDFEHHLGPSGPRTLPASVQRLNAELAYSLVTIAQAGDFVWAVGPPESDYPQHLAEMGLPEIRIVGDASDVPVGTELRPWGWSSHVKSWGTRNGWRCDCPDLAVVATVNSREFSSSLEREWNCGLPQARTVRSLQKFHEVVADATQQTAAWVVKANFGMSARERFLGRDSPPSQQAVQWVRKQLAESGAVYFEPWVEPLEEIGVQFTIPAAGQPVLEGITPLLTDSLGTYRGSRLRGPSGQLASIEGTAAVLEIVTRAAQRIQQLGYFGPLGIDAMRYRAPAGDICWRPLQDINARLTMGRLALGLRRCVRPDDHASWLHVRWAGTAAKIAERLAHIARSLPDGTRALRTSPITVGEHPTARGAILVTAPSAETLAAVEASVTRTNW